jgi:excisionase family DNA binding protein
MTVRLLSPRQVARALGVSESSLKRWVDAGKIAATRTDGGHRKIALSEAVRYVREHGAPIAHPELLDMPEVAVAAEREARGEDQLFDHLQAGDAFAARGWLMAHYLRGASIAELCDGPIRDAMHALGELWLHSEAGIFVEHRATDVCLQALAHVRATFDPPAGAPVALGGAPEDDPYLLTSFMVAMVTSAAGMRAVNLGADTPIMALEAAVAEHRPRLVWISATSALAPTRASEIAHWIASLPSEITAIVGGQESLAIAEAHPRVKRIETMGELAVIASGLAS